MPLEPVMSVKEEIVVANGKLHVLSLYGDFPASARARWAASTIARLAGPHWQTTSEMWKVDSLTVSQPIRDMITNDATNADAIIIAVSSLEQRALELIEWLNCMAVRGPKRSIPGLLIGLLGDEDGKWQELGWTVKQLIRCAQQADRHFIWHWMETSAMKDSDWLADSTEELLARKLAANNEMVFC
jgi:hypothetical protein